MDGLTPHLRVNGVDLHVAEAGPADGPLVILLHGFPEFWFAWRELIGPLAAAGFSVVAPDQRGYNVSGKSKAIDEYRLYVPAKDVLNVAEACGATTFRLVVPCRGGARLGARGPGDQRFDAAGAAAEFFRSPRTTATLLCVLGYAARAPRRGDGKERGLADEAPTT